jgi:large subunit ribosomal protein L10e
MKFSFGKPIGLAARIKKGQIIMEVKANNEEVARKALKRAAYKFPCKCSIIEA